MMMLASSEWDGWQQVDGVIRSPAMAVRQVVEDRLRVDYADPPKVVYKEEAPPVVPDLCQAVSDVGGELRLVPVGDVVAAAASIPDSHTLGGG